MDIVTKAKEFAINAHRGQVRKSDKEKPYAVHPIAVANLLKEYGYDENIQAAGALHDVKEDTNFTLEDIVKEFGPYIASLVDAASEEDKSLSWEERKKETIERTKNFSIDKKAVICADKINNLEELYLLFERNCKRDFSAFKRGEQQQRWYHENTYKSLINNEDPETPIFKRYKKAIDNVFNNPENLFYKNVLFLDDEDYYDKLKQIDAQKKELKRLRDLITINKPYIIEFTGTPRTGKTTTINNLYDFFKKGGFNVSIIEEFTTSKRYKENIYENELKHLSKGDLNLRVAEYVYEDLLNIANSSDDIVLIDRSLNDRQIWNYRRLLSGDLSEEKYTEVRDKYLKISNILIDYLVVTYASPLVSLRRDYQSSLALEERRFLNEENITDFNNALDDLRPLLEECVDGVSFVDTTNMEMRDVSLMVCQDVLSDMHKTYINNVQKQYK